MLRYTLHDSEKTISFIDDESLTQCFIAACTSEPETIEELLVAVEPYYSGITARVMQGLLMFDAELSGRGDDQTDGGKDELWQPTAPTIEVVDETTATIAAIAEEDGILTIDLERRDIAGEVANENVTTHGTITLSGPSSIHQKVAFVLSERWSVDLQSIEQSPNHATKGASYA
jgi:hypothetical protein